MREMNQLILYYMCQSLVISRYPLTRCLIWAYLGDLIEI